MIILELQKCWKNSEEFPYNLHPVFPYANVLSNHSTSMETRNELGPNL